jgi:hypothetical protein
MRVFFIKKFFFGSKLSTDDDDDDDSDSSKVSNQLENLEDPPRRGWRGWGCRAGQGEAGPLKTVKIVAALSKSKIHDRQIHTSTTPSDAPNLLDDCF